jgi:hypothetical protein
MTRKKLITAFGVVVLFSAGVLAVYAGDGFSQAKPFIYDPGKTHLVQGTWLEGIGCPTRAKIALYPSGTDTFTAGGCRTGDPSDATNQGLLLVKTGPTNNNASAGAVLKNVTGITLTELGYDLRKPGADQTDPRGSWCGAGAARFNVTTSDGLWFVGCNSPAPAVEASGGGWMRLRWTTGYKDGVTLSAITGTVQSISIVFDEGQDVAADGSFGVAIIDNIDVNGELLGSGKPGDHSDSSDKEGNNVQN